MCLSVDLNSLRGGLDFGVPATTSEHVGVLFSDILALRPGSLTVGDLTAFCAKVRKILSDCFLALSGIPRSPSLHGCLR